MRLIIHKPLMKMNTEGGDNHVEVDTGFPHHLVGTWRI